jgi:hypothetical protein
LIALATVAAERPARAPLAHFEVQAPAATELQPLLDRILAVARTGERISPAVA